MKRSFLVAIIALGIGNIAYANRSIQVMLNTLRSEVVQEAVGSKGHVLVVSQVSDKVSLTYGLSSNPRSGEAYQEFCLTFEPTGEMRKTSGACYGH